MAYLLFVDESGHDHRQSPYEVLAGIAVHDTQLWDWVCAIQDAELEIFGVRISEDRRELKAKALLKRKTFRLAAQLGAIPAAERAVLATAAFTDGTLVTREQLTALAQAKLAFVARVLELCGRYGVRCFASIVLPSAAWSAGTALRKDYAYLFQRFFHFVDDHPPHERGLIVFDEQDRSRSYVLINQMAKYFRQTATGRARSSRIVPEPFFVHSGLTTGIQVADIVSYVVSWNVRVGSMRAPARTALDPFGQQVLGLRSRPISGRDVQGNEYRVRSFAVIDDLRPRSERDLESE